MRNRYRIIILAVTASLVAACNGDMETPSPVCTAISLKTTLLEGTRSVSQNLQTTELVSGRKAGVYIYRNAYTSIQNNYGYENLEYTTAANGAFTSLATPYYPIQKEPVDVYVYLPRIISVATPEAVNFSVALDQSSEEEYLASDLITGKATLNATKETQNVSLNHRLCKVNVNISAGTGFAAADIMGATVKLLRIKASAKVNLFTGAVNASTLSESTNSITLCTVSDEESMKGSCIILPQTVSEGNMIQITLANGTTNYYLWGTATYSAGNVYTYNLTLTSKGLTASSNIRSWNTAGTATDGSAVLY